MPVSATWCDQLSLSTPQPILSITRLLIVWLRSESPCLCLYNIHNPCVSRVPFYFPQLRPAWFIVPRTPGRFGLSTINPRLRAHLHQPVMDSLLACVSQRWLGQRGTEAMCAVLRRMTVVLHI